MQTVEVVRTTLLDVRGIKLSLWRDWGWNTVGRDGVVVHLGQKPKVGTVGGEHLAQFE